MTSETVKVITRCRPLNQREKELKCKVIVDIDSSCGQCSLINPDDRSAEPKIFTFDGAYSFDSTTEQIYNEIVFPIVESVTEGYNGTVFAYGQTGCGKSFTMQGTSDSAHRGIIPRSFEHIFEAISTAENSKFLVQASYLEIYNEEIRDLLGTDIKKKLELKENPETGVYVGGLSMHVVNDVKACETIMEIGWKNRSVGATLMNADSSRSHSIFTIYVERLKTDDDLESNHVKYGKLNLVDLAGSERQSKTGAAGDRLKEATKINLSLSALGNVISALVDGKAKHIPFRDSKLTRLLQDSLGGNTKTLMVACISPADNNYDETLSTLRYANRAKNIKNKPRINEDPKDAKLREYQEEILWLRKMLQEQTANQDSSTGKLPINDNLVEEIKKSYDMKMKDLLSKYEEEVKNKEKLKEDINKLKSIYENGNVIHSGNVGNGQPTSTKPQQQQSTANNGNNNNNEQNNMETVLLHAMEKLKQIENQMVGGEKANDVELKEKRARKKKIAEAKLNAISEALKQLNNYDSDNNTDDNVLLKAYGDITEELKAKTMMLKKAKRKILSLEQEVLDLQSEFESERTDYLETIRRLNKQLKLLQQILDKIQPLLKNECNYFNLMKIKDEAQWDENLQQWILPNVTFGRIRLPPAAAASQHQQSQVNSNTNNNNNTNNRNNHREMTPNRIYRPDSPNIIFDSVDNLMFNADNQSNSSNNNNSGSNQLIVDDDGSGGYHHLYENEDKLLRKLENSQSDEIVTNYLMPKRKQQLLNTLNKLKLSVPSSGGLMEEEETASTTTTTMIMNNYQPQLNGLSTTNTSTLMSNNGLNNNNHNNNNNNINNNSSFLSNGINGFDQRFNYLTSNKTNSNNRFYDQPINQHYHHHHQPPRLTMSSGYTNGGFHYNHNHNHHHNGYHQPQQFSLSAEAPARKLLPLKRIT